LPNNWEREFGEELRKRQLIGDIVWVQYEGMRFRLAGGAFYKPDFVSLSRTGEMTAWEVKGRWREAARVRIKVAADIHPILFIAVTKDGSKRGLGWVEERFSAARDRIIK
jgi:hypothetical protein